MSNNAPQRVIDRFSHWVCFLTAAHSRSNPSFPVTGGSPRRFGAAMRSEPLPLARPLVIIGGFGDLGFNPVLLSNRLDSVAMSDGIVAVAIGECPTFNMLPRQGDRRGGSGLSQRRSGCDGRSRRNRLVTRRRGGAICVAPARRRWQTTPHRPAVHHQQPVAGRRKRTGCRRFGRMRRITR